MTSLFMSNADIRGGVDGPDSLDASQAVTVF